MNDIEVGEYIRTNQGHIGVLKRIEFDRNDKSLKWYIFDKKEFEINTIKEECVNKPYIVKHSKNITDLIEVGDIVILEDEFDKNIYYMYDESFVEAVKQDVKEGETLKSILTREEFEKRKYKI